MNLVFFLKILADLCYYGIFAAFFGSIYGLESSLLPHLCLIALAGMLSRMAEERRPSGFLRFLPLALPALCIFLPTQTAGWVILAPAVLYVLWCAVRRLYDTSYFQSVDTFLRELKILPLPALLAIALLQSDRIEAFSLPYLVVFLLTSVLLLRMVRHDEDTLCQPRFRLMNGVTMAGLLLVCAALGSDWFLRGVGIVAGAVWNVLSIPFLLVFGGIGMAISWMLEAIMPDDPNFEPIKPSELILNMMETEEQEQGILQDAVQTNPFLSYVISALIALLAIVLIVLLFRWLSARGRRDTAAGGIQTRTSATPLTPGEKPLTRLSARTPAQKVRYWYQQLLRRTRDEGGTLRPSMDSAQQQAVGTATLPDSEASIARLRELYLPARYADRADEQAVKDAKALYQSIKKD